jgi:hypothetical protein
VIGALALWLAAERSAIGVYAAWGAFREGARCYAIAAPVAAGAQSRWRPFASVATRFGRDRRAALFVRLSGTRDLAAPVTLAIGDRRFALSGDDTAVWAPDAATDRAIVAAMRGARSMSVSAVTPAGRPFADSYALGGAATAVDAATLGCR